ncbi:MAG: hypothetical protein V3T62_05140, partial [Alphaproteobacteria bacterium]
MAPLGGGLSNPGFASCAMAKSPPNTHATISIARTPKRGIYGHRQNTRPPVDKPVGKRSRKSS